jgi:hypothetical protein
MGGSGNRAALEGARDEIEAIAAEFSAAAREIVADALRRRLEALLVARAEWFGALESGVATALREAAERAILQGADQAAIRVGEPELWLSPLVVPGGVREANRGWNDLNMAGLTGFLRRVARRMEHEDLGRLDDANHRVWVALLAAAKPLDPVLAEFGLPASEVPNPGGGHYGIQPTSAALLDPSGSLDRLWRRFRLVYARYDALLRDAG